jgi:hypothetical protein
MGGWLTGSALGHSQVLVTKRLGSGSVLFAQNDFRLNPGLTITITINLAKAD